MVSQLKSKSGRSKFHAKLIRQKRPRQAPALTLAFHILGERRAHFEVKSRVCMQQRAPLYRENLDWNIVIPGGNIGVCVCAREKAALALYVHHPSHSHAHLPF